MRWIFQVIDLDHNALVTEEEFSQVPNAPLWCTVSEVVQAVIRLDVPMSSDSFETIFTRFGGESTLTIDGFVAAVSALWRRAG